MAEGKHKLRMLATLLAIAMMVIANWGVASADHQGATCTTCHAVHGESCGDYSNIRLIRCYIETPNSGTVKAYMKPLVCHNTGSTR